MTREEPYSPTLASPLYWVALPIYRAHTRMERQERFSGRPLSCSSMRHLSARRCNLPRQAQKVTCTLSHASCIWYEAVTVVLLHTNFMQIFSGRHPWMARSHPESVSVVNRVRNGHRPSKLEDIEAQYWSLIEQCWAMVPNSRPTISNVLQRLQ